MPNWVGIGFGLTIRLGLADMVSHLLLIKLSCQGELGRVGYDVSV